MTSIPEGSIVITPTEMYNEVRDLTGAVRELVATDKADAKERAALTVKVEAIDVRLTALEKKVWFVAGICAAVGGTVGSALAPVLVR